MAGCSLMPNKSGGKPEEQKPSEQTSPQVPDSSGKPSGSFKTIPNPNKLASRPKVPAKAKADFSKAISLMEAKRWKEAESVLVPLTGGFPNLAGPYVNLGITQAALDKKKQAESSWNKAIRINPLNFDAYTSLAVFYREEGRFKEAEAVYLKALKIWPHHPSSIKNLGVLYDLYMGRFEAALAQYNLYVKVIGREDKQMKGWIADLNRRIAANKRKK